NAAPIANWSAGAGVNYILDNDATTFNYLFPPNGTPNIAQIGATASVDKREIPIFLSLPTWAQWLPTIAPQDGYANFTGSGLYGRYLGMRSNLTKNLTSYITNQQPDAGGTGSSLASDFYTWIFTDRQELGIPPTNSTPTTNNYALQLAHWQDVKAWELNQ